MPYRIHVDGSPKAEFNKREVAITLAQGESFRERLVEVWQVDSHGRNQKLIKRWRNGKEVG
jgi:hypothetical protein